MIAAFGGYVGVRDRRAKKWRDLYDLADSERKEVQHSLDEVRKELDHARGVIAEQKEIITKLDALQMPIRIVELMNEMALRIDRHAADRLSNAMETVHEGFENQEITAAERHQKLIECLDTMIDELRALKSDEEESS